MKKTDGTEIIQKEISFCGKKCILACDAKCEKAWGINSRPKVELSSDPDNYELLADGELGEAPIDPGTYEGGDEKPQDKFSRLNRWCARECERSVMIDVGDPLKLPDYSKRFKNIPG
jgi:hypothetical protein